MIVAILEQEESADMEKIKEKLLEMKKLANFDILAINEGDPGPYHKVNGLFIAFMVVGGIGLLISLVLCWKFSCCRKLKNKFTKKQITYEMYGEFRD